MPHDVVFVQMPFAAVERPSLALGLFTASLRAANVSTEAIYANIGFAERVGVPAYVLVRLASPETLVGEWIFAKSAFREETHKLAPLSIHPGHFDVDEWFIDRVVEHCGYRDLGDFLQGMQDKASRFVEKLDQQIFGMGPRVVACTSMFDQHVASLSLLRGIKERSPDVITVLGGANCSGPMGRATHHAFPWVDFTVTGEFDQYAVDFFTELVESGGDLTRIFALPPNVLGPTHRQGQRKDVLPPWSILRDMDAAAIPDYDDFFEQLYSSPISPYVLASIQLETSRGCWWGAKQHCTFCGLNADGMAFRKKTPSRALEEIRWLTSRYGLFRWAASDNIIDMSYFRTVLPELAADEQEYQFFYETKANLKREQVQAFAEAGCRYIQPGIESLHDETLEIMRKGTTACINIRLLKHCLEFGVVPAWSILCGFPGSDPEWVAEIATELPFLFHLPPPTGTTPIRFDRFSPYHEHQSQYGLDLQPLPTYREVYPLDDKTLEDLAYFFRATGGLSKTTAEAARISYKVTARWRNEFWSENRPELIIEEDDGDAIKLRDTRPVATASSHELYGFAAILLRALESPIARQGVLKRLQLLPRLRFSERDVDSVLSDLWERRLIWRSRSQFISLVTPPPRRRLEGKEDAAVGKLDVLMYSEEQTRFHRAFMEGSFNSGRES